LRRTSTPPSSFPDAEKDNGCCSSRSRSEDGGKSGCDYHCRRRSCSQYRTVPRHGYERVRQLRSSTTKAHLKGLVTLYQMAKNKVTTKAAPVISKPCIRRNSKEATTTRNITNISWKSPVFSNRIFRYLPSEESSQSSSKYGSE